MLTYFYQNWLAYGMILNMCKTFENMNKFYIIVFSRNFSYNTTFTMKIIKFSNALVKKIKIYGI